MTPKKIGGIFGTLSSARKLYQRRKLQWNSFAKIVADFKDAWLGSVEYTWVYA